MDLPQERDRVRLASLPRFLVRVRKVRVRIGLAFFLLGGGLSGVFLLLQWLGLSLRAFPYLIGFLWVAAILLRRPDFARGQDLLLYILGLVLYFGHVAVRVMGEGIWMLVSLGVPWFALTLLWAFRPLPPVPLLDRYDREGLEQWLQQLRETLDADWIVLRFPEPLGWRLTVGSVPESLLPLPRTGWDWVSPKRFAGVSVLGTLLPSGGLWVIGREGSAWRGRRFSRYVKLVSRYLDLLVRLMVEREGRLQLEEELARRGEALSTLTSLADALHAFLVHHLTPQHQLRGFVEDLGEALGAVRVALLWEGFRMAEGGLGPLFVPEEERWVDPNQLFARWTLFRTCPSWFSWSDAVTLHLVHGDDRALYLLILPFETFPMERGVLLLAFDSDPVLRRPEAEGLLALLGKLAALAVVHTYLEEVSRRDQEELAREIHRARQNRRFLETLVAQFPQGILLTDAEERILLANPRAQEYLGLPLKPGAPLPDLLAEVRRRRMTEDQIVNGRILEISRCPVGGDALDPTEHWWGSLYLLTDVTERRRVEEGYRHFLQSLAHNLKRPIGEAERRLLSLLKERVENGLQQEVTQIQELLHRSRDGVDRFLSLTHLKALPAPKLEPMEVDELLTTLEQGFQRRMEARGLTFRVRYPEEPALILLAEEPFLMEALENLLDNALRYTPPGGWVELGARRDAPGWILFWVRDTGIGVPADRVEAIFEPFVRLEGGRKMSEGFGLGLAYVAEVARRHGGQVWVEENGEEGRGTVFYLRIPEA